MKKLIIPAILVLASFTTKAQTDSTITLKLTVNQVNVLLNALADRKLGESFDTYLAVRVQAVSQMSARTSKTDSSKKVEAKKPEDKKEIKKP